MSQIIRYMSVQGSFLSETFELEGTEQMARYNTTFDLDVDDLELIEDALRARKSELSLDRLTLLAANTNDSKDDALAELDEAISATHALLGHLHNQKVFFRPKAVKQTPYIGG